MNARSSRGTSKYFPEIIIIAIHVAVLAYSASRHTPTFNEIGHVPAGISHWQYGRFELYRVNPPLPRMVATLPLLYSDVAVNWENYQTSAFAREEIWMGIRFSRANASKTVFWFTICRWMCIPFSVVGAIVCCLWASDLWGRRAGLVALIMWTANPTVIGHGALVMPDVPAASCSVLAAYTFRNWINNPDWGGSFKAGVSLGLALLCKSTLVVLPVLWLMLWTTTKYRILLRAGALQSALMMAVIIGIGFHVLNSGYLYQGSGKRLGEYKFQSVLLTTKVDAKDVGENRFAGTQIGSIRVPVPEAYVLGLDRQRYDFELGDRSYMRGQWKRGGWWYYYLYATAVKTPVGFVANILLAAITSSLFRSQRKSFIEELCLLLPGVVIVALVSSQTGFSNHMRYLMPAMPFFIISGARVAIVPSKRLRKWVGVFLVYGILSSIASYPHSISYFNEFAGGPVSGNFHLLDSNTAWGQDLIYLREWMEAHPEATPLNLVSFGWFDPTLIGIQFREPEFEPHPNSKFSFRPKPGWYAIDVNHLRGTHWPTPDGIGGWKEFDPIEPNPTCFLSYSPVDFVGYSILIFHVKND